MLDLLRIIADFGLVVLIWLVQLVIYPSFRFYPKEQLIRWHDIYTQRVTYVVLPLMLGQLVLASIQFYSSINWYSSSSIALIAAAWAATFLVFVPLHARIAAGNFETQDLGNLVLWNWWRTLIWTSLFLLNF